MCIRDRYTIGGKSSISISGGSTFTGNIYGGSYSKVPGNTGSTLTTACLLYTSRCV